jgi:hypothetical protein
MQHRSAPPLCGIVGPMPGTNVRRLRHRCYGKGGSMVVLTSSEDPARTGESFIRDKSQHSLAHGSSRSDAMARPTGRRVRFRAGQNPEEDDMVVTEHRRLDAEPNGTTEAGTDEQRRTLHMMARAPRNQHEDGHPTTTSPRRPPCHGRSVPRSCACPEGSGGVGCASRDSRTCCWLLRIADRTGARGLTVTPPPVVHTGPFRAGPPKVEGGEGQG